MARYPQQLADQTRFCRRYHFTTLGINIFQTPAIQSGVQNQGSHWSKSFGLAAGVGPLCCVREVESQMHQTARSILHLRTQMALAGPLWPSPPRKLQRLSLALDECHNQFLELPVAVSSIAYSRHLAQTQSQNACGL